MKEPAGIQWASKCALGRLALRAPEQSHPGGVHQLARLAPERTILRGFRGSGRVREPESGGGLRSGRLVVSLLRGIFRQLVEQALRTAMPDVQVRERCAPGLRSARGRHQGSPYPDATDERLVLARTFVAARQP